MDNIINVINLEQTILLDIENRINSILFALPQLEQDITMVLKDNKNILDYCTNTNINSKEYKLAKDNLDKIIRLQQLFNTISVKKGEDKNVL